MPSNLTWGGARPGAGRPRTRVTLLMPADVMRRLDELADERETLPEEVVKLAILRYLEAHGK